MNDAATFVLVIVVGLAVVNASPCNSRSRRQTENQVCRQSNVDGTITVWVPPTSDSGDYIIARDPDTPEKFRLCSNDPVSKDLTIFVHPPTGWYLIPGNLTRRIEIRHSTQDIVYYSGRIDNITQCEAGPCGEDVMSYGCPKNSSTVPPSVSTSHNISKMNPEDGSHWHRATIALPVVLLVVLIILLLCRMYVVISGIFVSLSGQCQKIKSKSDPERTVPQHIKRYCTLNFLEISDFQRIDFETTHFECGIFQYLGRVFPLYVYEGELGGIPHFDSLPNGFMVPKAGNDDITLQVYSTARELINDLKIHLENSHRRDIEHRRNMEEENETLTWENSELNSRLQQLEQTRREENERLTRENFELNSRLQQLEQTRRDELNKLEEENKRLTLKNSKLNSRLQQLEQAGLEKRSHKVLGGNHDQRFLENWEKVKLPTSEQQIEESKEESALLFEEAQNNAPEQSDPSSFTDEFGSQDHPYVQEDH